MYTVVLGLHSWIRWILLISMVLILFRSIGGMKKGTYTSTDKNAALVLFWALNIQFILGLALYFFVSPLMQAAFGNMAETMANASVRFFVAEHFVIMLIAIALGHVGVARSKRETDPARKHKLLLIWIGLCLLVVIVGIPWPFLPYGRGLFFF